MTDFGHKPSIEKPYITLTCNPYEHESSVNTRVTIEVMQKDISRDDLLEVFEGFMKAMGYHFDDNENITIERYTPPII